MGRLPLRLVQLMFLLGLLGERETCEHVLHSAVFFLGLVYNLYGRNFKLLTVYSLSRIVLSRPVVSCRQGGDGLGEREMTCPPFL